MWKQRNTIGEAEEQVVLEVIQSGKLSGFVAGPPDERDVPNGGLWVRKLEAKWQEKYGVKHAVSFNSATTGLLAAYKAADVIPGSHVITTPWTMSATAAAAISAGATVDFADIEPKYYCIDPNRVIDVYQLNSAAGLDTRAVCAVNLFGHPCQLELLREICDERNMFLIEDSAQMPWANEYDNKIIGDVAVYSLNRHKHIHCGEGGMACTNDDELARKLRSVRNHGIDPIGLNLRMTELEAAVACCQLDKLEEEVKHARDIGNVLCGSLKDYMEVPETRQGCEHDFYLWTAKYDRYLGSIPHIAGYIQPLHKIFTGGQADCPVVEEMREKVICFECCKWDTPPEEIAEAFLKAIQ